MQQLLAMLVVLLVLVPLSVFWIRMFQDMNNNPYLPSEARNTWLMLFLFFNIFGAVYYYSTVYKHR